MAIWQLSLLLILSSSFGVRSTILTLKNTCTKTIWPGVVSTSKHPPLMKGGFEMKPGQTLSITAPPGWSGRLWARTGCSLDKTGAGRCTTGDCGGVLQCEADGNPPATLVELSFDVKQDLEFYDVSLTKGYNIPVTLTPSSGIGNCTNIPCVSDLNLECPVELQVKSQGRVVGCKSACMAFGTDIYCCYNKYNDPELCKASKYSEVFKKACPLAYIDPYDHAKSIFTCLNANYLIKFC